MKRIVFYLDAINDARLFITFLGSDKPNPAIFVCRNGVEVDDFLTKHFSNQNAVKSGIVGSILFFLEHQKYVMKKHNYQAQIMRIDSLYKDIKRLINIIAPFNPAAYIGTEILPLFTFAADENGATQSALSIVLNNTVLICTSPTDYFESIHKFLNDDGMERILHKELYEQIVAYALNNVTGPTAKVWLNALSQNISKYPKKGRE